MLLDFLGLKKTDITDKHITAVKEHVLTKHIDLSSAICDKQREVFNAYMKELDYLWKISELKIVAEKSQGVYTKILQRDPLK